MTQESVLTIAQHALVVTILLAGPVLLVSMAVGLVVSIFQAVTQINEMTLSFIPKAVAVFGTLIILGPWMMSVILTYTQQLFIQVGSIH